MSFKNGLANPLCILLAVVVVTEVTKFDLFIEIVKGAELWLRHDGCIVGK